MNLFVIEGKLGGDAELKYTPSGNAVVSFSVAVSESFKKKGSTDWDKITEWFHCEWWGEYAAQKSDFLKKGSPLMIRGKIRTKKWDDKEGQKREMKYILCEKVKVFAKDVKRTEPEQNNLSDSQYVPDDVPY